MTPPSFAGFVDRIDAEVISGWASKTSAPQTSTYVTIYLDGQSVGTAPCQAARPDAERAGYVGARAFTFDPRPFLAGVDKLIQVGFEGLPQLVPGGSLSLRAAGDEARIGAHWSAVYQRKSERVVRWWESDYVVRQINRKVCGAPLSGISSGLHQHAVDRFAARIPFGAGISVGGGTGFKELDLIQRGLVSRFTIYDLSEYAISAGRQRAAAAGCADRCTFIGDDAFRCETRAEAYDLVYWNNALHHMLDVGEALRWSRQVLRPGGLFLMDDFVGPNRMQWSQRLLDINTAFLHSLPAHYFRDPHDPNLSLSRVAQRPNPQGIIASDPSECADSQRILPELARHFPEAEVTLTGGGIYHLGLNDILDNIVAAGDTATLDRALALDQACVDLGETHYATAMAIKL
jgi:SAM-dependent methyltransferase